MLVIRGKKGEKRKGGGKEEGEKRGCRAIPQRFP